MRNGNKTKKQLIEKLRELQQKVTELEEEAVELKEKAVKDSSTGLFNRRYFVEIIPGEISRAERNKFSVGFMMIDVNRFKKVNDSLGHQVGDELLKQVAGVLQEQAREMDIVIRWGGDEFLIVLPQIGNGLMLVVERLRKAMEKWNLSDTGINFSITLSIGTSIWDPKEPEDIEIIIDKADKAMYEEKRRECSSR